MLVRLMMISLLVGGVSFEASAQRARIATDGPRNVQNEGQRQTTPTVNLPGGLDVNASPVITDQNLCLTSPLADFVSAVTNAGSNIAADGFDGVVRELVSALRQGRDDAQVNSDKLVELAATLKSESPEAFSAFENMTSEVVRYLQGRKFALNETVQSQMIDGKEVFFQELTITPPEGSLDTDSLTLKIDISSGQAIIGNQVASADSVNRLMIMRALNSTASGQKLMEVLAAEEMSLDQFVEMCMI
jgi:hypothetical protein